MKNYKLVIITVAFAIAALVFFRIAIWANDRNNAYQMPEDYMVYYMIIDDIKKGTEILDETDTIDLYVKSEADSNTMFALPLLENLVVRKVLTEAGEYTEDAKDAHYLEIHVPKDIYVILQSIESFPNLTYEITETEGKDENFTINLKLQEYISENYTVMETEF